MDDFLPFGLFDGIAGNEGGVNVPGQKQKKQSKNKSAGRDVKFKPSL